MAKKILKNKKILVALSLVAVAAVGGALYLKFFHNAAPKTEQEQLQEQEKKAGPEDPKTNNEAYRRQQAAQKATNEGAATIYMSSLSQDDANVYVNAIVENQTNGTCTATFSQGGSAFTRTAPIGLVTNYYTCQGFTIPKSSFPSKGAWSVKIEFSNSTAKGSTETQTLNLN